MLQLLVMDLDGTLADFNTAIQPKTIELLRKLQSEGVRLVLSSGKEAGHLAGLVRQTGLENVILIADNGGVINYSHHYPPIKSYIFEMTSVATQEMAEVQKALQAEFGDKIWIQPNQTTFSLFGRGVDIKKVYEFCDRVFKEKKIKHLKNFKTGGALDVSPMNVDKGVALKLIQEELNIHLEDTAVIGDGSNDIPMFLRGKIRLTFPKSAELFKKLVPKIVKDINAALKFLLDLMEFEKITIMDSLV